jgi:head-tail adaptor
MTVAAGQMDARLQFLEAVAVDDGLAVSETWAPVGSPRWCKVRWVSGQEEQAGGQVQAGQLLRFTVRKDRLTSSITAANRIRFQGTDHVIVAVAPDYAGGASIDFTASVRADL